MIRTLLTRIWLILARRDIEFAELQAGVLALAWGGWIANPGAEAFRQTAQFWQLERQAPEWVWGVTAIVIAMNQLASLVSLNRTWRRWSAFATFWFWAFLAIQFGVANIESPVILLYGMFALGALWVHLRISIEAIRVIRSMEGGRDAIPPL